MDPAEMREHERAWLKRERRKARPIATLCALFFNANRDSKKTTAVSVEDFMPMEDCDD